MTEDQKITKRMFAIQQATEWCNTITELAKTGGIVAHNPDDVFDFQYRKILSLLEGGDED